jgi:hypothetical protein
MEPLDTTVDCMSVICGKRNHILSWQTGCNHSSNNRTAHILYKQYAYQLYEMNTKSWAGDAAFTISQLGFIGPST